MILDRLSPGRVRSKVHRCRAREEVLEVEGRDLDHRLPPVWSSRPTVPDIWWRGPAAPLVGGDLAAAKAAAVFATARTTVNGAWAAYWIVSNNLAGTIWNACEAAVEAGARFAVQAHRAGADQMAAWDAARAVGTGEQASFLREVLGNPFRPSLGSCDWLAWRGGLLAEHCAGIAAAVGGSQVR